MVAAPSIMAASMTCPCPEARVSKAAQAMPKASSIPPPAKSASTLIGGVGGWPGRPNGSRGPGPGGGARWLAGAPQRLEGAGHGEVVDVVAGPCRVRTLLTEAGEPSVDEGGVAGHAGAGADPEPLGHAGAEHLEEGVGGLAQAEHDLDAAGLLEVD